MVKILKKEGQEILNEFYKLSMYSTHNSFWKFIPWLHAYFICATCIKIVKKNFFTETSLKLMMKCRAILSIKKVYQL